MGSCQVFDRSLLILAIVFAVTASNVTGTWIGPGEVAVKPKETKPEQDQFTVEHSSSIAITSMRCPVKVSCRRTPTPPVSHGLPPRDRREKFFPGERKRSTVPFPEVNRNNWPDRQLSFVKKAEVPVSSTISVRHISSPHPATVQRRLLFLHSFQVPKVSRLRYSRCLLAQIALTIIPSSDVRQPSTVLPAAIHADPLWVTVRCWLTVHCFSLSSAC